MLLQNLNHVLLNLNVPPQSLQSLARHRRQVLPVLGSPEIEKDLPAGRALDQERPRGERGHILHSRQGRPHEV